MQAVSEHRIGVLDPTFVEQMYECLDCRACEAVCPSGVRYGEVLEAARSQVERARARSGRRGLRERLLRRFVFGAVLANLRVLRLLAAGLRLYQSSALRTVLKGSGVLRILGFERLEQQAPDVSARFFTPHGQRYAAVPFLATRGTAGADVERRGLVGLHAGCVMHVALAEVDRATVRVLTRNGWDVAVPVGQGCCGALHIHAGEAEGGRERARQNITAFEDAEVDVIVSNAAGCGAALKEYGQLLRDDAEWAERAAAFSARVRDVTELLAAAPLRGDLKQLDCAVTYQDACHLLHAQGIATQPRSLLKAIPGLRLFEMAETALCCGSAGVYSLTHPEMSAQLLESRIDQILAPGAHTVATVNPGCMLQLRNGLRRRGPHGKSPIEVRHVVELLDAAYGQREGASVRPP